MTGHPWPFFIFNIMKVFRSNVIDDIGIILVAANSSEEATAFFEKEKVEDNLYTYYYKTYVEMSYPEEVKGMTADVNEPTIIMEEI